MSAHQPVIHALQKLAEALKNLTETGKEEYEIPEVPSWLQNLNKKELDVTSQLAALTFTTSKITYNQLSHWREDIPEDVSKAYEMILAGANLIEGTSTKFTLVERVEANQGAKLVQDLQKGAEVLITGVFVLFDKSAGCAISTQYHAKKLARNVLASLIQLLEVFVSGEAFGNKDNGDNNLGAQKTGAVWQSCKEVCKVPRGNRNSIRRDLFQWAKDCNVTIEEFQEIVDEGPADTHDGNESSAAIGIEEVVVEEDCLWDDFCMDGSEQYSKDDFCIAKPCLAILKCSRGTIGNILKICEYLGELKHESGDSAKTKRAIYERMAVLIEIGRKIGNGVTDLGSLLYPPLDTKGSSDFMGTLNVQVLMAYNANYAIVELSSSDKHHCIPKDISDLSANLLKSLEARYKEIIESLK